MATARKRKRRENRKRKLREKKGGTDNREKIYRMKVSKEERERKDQRKGNERGYERER